MSLSLTQACLQLFRRELLLSVRQPGEILNPLVFFLIVVSLFPLAISSDIKLLQIIAPGLIWVSALLAVFLSMDRLFREDVMDGCLEQLLISGQPLAVLMLVKLFAHWVLTGLPLVLLVPLLSMVFYLSSQAAYVLFLSLLIGTPLLILVGAIGAALTINLRTNGVLLALLTLPLFIPILIFGSGSVMQAQAGMNGMPSLGLLSAGLLFALSLAPITIAASVRIRLMR